MRFTIAQQQSYSITYSIMRNLLATYNISAFLLYQLFAKSHDTPMLTSVHTCVALIQ